MWISLGMVPALNDQGVSRMPEWEDMISVGVAAHNAHLVAASLGLGAKWTSGAVVTHPWWRSYWGWSRPRATGLPVRRPACGGVAAGARRPLSEIVRWETDERPQA